MAIRSTIEDREDGTLFTGSNEPWRIEIEWPAWVEACLVMTMCGIERRIWMKQAHQVDEWLSDDTRCGLDGVTIQIQER